MAMSRALKMWITLEFGPKMAMNNELMFKIHLNYPMKCQSKTSNSQLCYLGHACKMFEEHEDQPIYYLTFTKYVLGLPCLWN